MEPSDYNIFDLIPQRPPMVMIDKLIYADPKTGKGIFYITESNPFCFNGQLLEAGMMECIAQTAAAFTGYSRLSMHEEVKKGYIGSVKNLVVYSLPSAGTEIQSEITLENELLGFTIITGRIKQNDNLLAECEMRILIEVDDEAEK
jgi:3-hydroxymyristoyl/3-hydroxydecanoyl-(acyl carrier protein) dehydratase